MRALECPKCGAPVRGEVGAAQAVCTYCGTHLVHAPHAPQPAKHRAAAPASAPQKFEPTHLLIPLALVLLVVGGAAALFLQSRSAVSATAGGAAAGKGAAAAELTRLALASDAQSVAKQFGATVQDSKRVNVTFRDSSVKSANLSWGEPSQITGIHLAFREGAATEPVLASLRAQLGRALHPASTGGHQFTANGVTLSLSSSLSLNAHALEAPGWKERLSALWAAVKVATFQSGEALDLDTRRNVLNIDNSLLELQQLSVDTSIDEREAAVRKIFPGAAPDRVGFSIGLGHPWFNTMIVSWENKAGGRVSQANFYYWTDPKGGPSLDAVERCLTPALKSAKRQVTDHAKGTYSLDWPARGGAPRVHATPQLVMILNNAGMPTQAGWSRVMTALAGCT
jgi:hypothetical protein